MLGCDGPSLSLEISVFQVSQSRRSQTLEPIDAEPSGVSWLCFCLFLFFLNQVISANSQLF